MFVTLEIWMCGIVETKDYINKARFLYGESMGGAVVLHIHRKEPQEWNGAILQAPMCKVQFHLISRLLLLSELCYADPRLFSNTTPASLYNQAHDIYMTYLTHYQQFLT
jgi:alpha-beta hydrolase superfamily lysophospholipase